jgi:dTDP-4-amino-4,6-dideoxygalactose transaminase
MIAYFDYRPQLRELRAEIDDAIRRVLDSGRVILGSEVGEFESEFAAAGGVAAAVGVASGTDALGVALRALGVGSADEVITVANAGVPPVAAIRAVGATPRWVDVDPATLLMDPTLLEGVLTTRTRCVLPVHLYGQAVEMEPVLRFASRHGLEVVEDCAQAQGATYREKPLGSLGDVGCFSFYPTKTMGAFGDGGMCATGNADLAERLRMIRMYGFRDDRHAHVEGVNSRLDELQAAILRVKLRHLDDAVSARRKIAARYRDGLEGGGCRLLGATPEATHVHHLFVVRVSDRERVTAALAAESVGFGIHYPEPVHLMEAYRDLGEGEGSLPVTESACREVLSLPIYPGLEPADVERVVRTIRAVC